jgi:hypothetical protein
MFWRYFLLSACMALGTASAEAQSIRVYGGPHGIELPIGALDRSDSVESLTAELSQSLANYDNSGIDVREGVVRPGEIFATRIVPYEATRRLRNEVTRSGALGGRVVLLPAGTPLYLHELINSDVMFLHGQARARVLWCGVNGSQTHCLMERGGEWEAAEIRADAPYAPGTFGAFVPVSTPQLAADPTALGELPARADVFRLERMRGSRAVLARAIRIGDDVIEIDTIQVARLQPMRLGSIMIAFEPGPEAGSATVSANALDPADHQDALRNLAHGLMGRRE